MNNLFSIYSTHAKKLLALCLPIMMSELASSMGTFFGTLMIARVGQESLAALALINSSFITLMGSCWGMLISIGVLASHSYGAKQFEDIRTTVGQGFWLAFLLSIPVILLLRLATPIFLSFDQKPSIVALAQNFFNPASFGILPCLCAAVLQQFVLTLKRSRVVMICTIASVIFGIPLNYLFIFGKFGFPAIGIAGIGWTVTAVNVFIFLFMMTYVLINQETRSYRVFNAIFQVAGTRLKELISIGWTIGALFGVEICGLLAAVVICGWLGNQSLAAYQIASQCMIVAIMIPWSISQGTTLLIGHAMGEQKIKKAKQIGFVAMGLSSLITFMITLVFWFFPSAIIRLFLNMDNANNLALVELIIPMLKLLGWTIFFDGIRLIACSALRGMKDTRFALATSILGFWIIGLPLGYSFAFFLHLGVLGIWYGDLIGVLCGLCVLVWRFALTK